MFKESIESSKKKSKKDLKKSKTGAEIFNNQKYVEVQLIKMGNILKDTSKVKDKTIKRSLALLKEYLAWEKEKKK